MPAQTATAALAADLAAGFPAADPALWRAQVEKLTGAAPDRLARAGRDRLRWEALYRGGADEARRVPPPGAPPYLRGAIAAMGATRCENRVCVAHPDPSVARARVREALDGGADRVALCIDGALALGAAAPDGILVHDLADLAALLDGSDLARTPLALEAGWRTPEVAALLTALRRQAGLGPATQHVPLGADPFAGVAAGLPHDLDEAIGRAVALATWCAAEAVPAPALRADGAPWHAGGASAALELAVVIAAATHALRVLEGAGIEPARAAPLIAFRLALDADVTTGIVKLRALRRLWYQVTAACGASAAGMTIEAVTASRMLTRREVEVNLLRATAAAFAALAGGAAALTVTPHDAVPDEDGRTGDPSPLARRLARNLPHVLRLESGIGRVLDPAGGSWMAEAATAELAQEAWALFQAIEGGGGLPSMLLRGSVQEWVAEGWELRSADVARRVYPLTGISEFPDPGGSAASAAPPPVAEALVAAAGAKLAAALPCRDLGMAAMIEQAAAGRALLASLAHATMTGVPQRRLAEAFEALRDRGDAALAAHGRRPRVYLVEIGRARDHAEAAALARNLAVAGGLDTVSSGGLDEPAAAAAGFAASGAAFAALCGAPQPVAVLEGWARALGSAGALRVWLMGGAADGDAAGLQAVGIDAAIVPGADIVDLLLDAWAAIGDQP